MDKGETSGSEFIHSVIERYHDCLWSGVITYTSWYKLWFNPDWLEENEIAGPCGITALV